MSTTNLTVQEKDLALFIYDRPLIQPSRGIIVYSPYSFFNLDEKLDDAVITYHISRLRDANRAANLNVNGVQEVTHNGKPVWRHPREFNDEELSLEGLAIHPNDHYSGYGEISIMFRECYTPTPTEAEEIARLGEMPKVSLETMAQVMVLLSRGTDQKET